MYMFPSVSECIVRMSVWWDGAEEDERMKSPSGG